jgi:hypothetical protein
MNLQLTTQTHSEKKMKNIFNKKREKNLPVLVTAVTSSIQLLHPT